MKRLICAFLVLVLCFSAALAESAGLTLKQFKIPNIGSIFLPENSSGQYDKERDENGWLHAEISDEGFRLKIDRMDAKSGRSLPATLTAFSQLPAVTALLPEGISFDRDMYNVLCADFDVPDEYGILQNTHISLIEGDRAFLILTFTRPADTSETLDFGMLSATAATK